MNGIQLVSWIRGNISAMPVAIGTGSMDDGVLSSISSCGADAVFHKPCGMEELLDVVKKLVPAA